LPLSRDHKPELADEATRIINQNGRIEQSKILPGLNAQRAAGLQGGYQYYGPKRVWLKSKQIPGLAMTRSIGDLIAKTVGVTQEPEIKVFEKLREQDRVLVLASDGIWDRLPNDDICPIIRDFHTRGDPNGACQELIRVSVDRWQKEHGMVDDITVLVIFLKPIV
jgi:serine/threonine protein phosphatase PrpC